MRVITLVRSDFRSHRSPLSRTLSALSALIPLLVAPWSSPAFGANQYTFLSPPFTQDLWVVGNPNNDRFVGIAFDANDDVWLSTCTNDQAQLRRYGGAPLPPSTQHTSPFVHPLQITGPDY